ncbi:MAG: SIR2 family protein [Acidobacteria bacterium]|nr:SIR2 family protein [Acidobacteriota bacterium]
MIRKLAHAQGEQCEPDPEAWYRRTAQSEPDYSDILDQITRSSTERMQLLRGYFEPTEEDRQENRKAPTAAHRAIARLVAKGYIRVIVTTNFDRLLEIALTDEGVQPTVISTTEAIQGAVPLAHSPCTIVKIHGDYRDTRVRNTKKELASYDPAMDTYLDRIFDEYGIVVCGWSAEWDIALRLAVERCSTRRFGTYWTTFGATGPASQKLMDFRAAAQIPITGADAFFKELSDKVQAIEDLSIQDPLEPKVAVARLKRYLRSEDHLIDFHDLLSAETERVYAAINSQEFSAHDSTLHTEGIVKRLSHYEAELHCLLPMAVCAGYWAAKDQQRCLLNTLTRIGNIDQTANGYPAWLSLRRYPGCLLLYAIGLGAVASSNYSLLGKIFALKIREHSHGQHGPVTELLSPSHIMRDVDKKLFTGRQRHFTPLNDHILDVLRKHLGEYLPTDHLYSYSFDWFEHLLALAHCHLTFTDEELQQQAKQGHQLGFWAPPGHYTWNQIDGVSIAQTAQAPDDPHVAAVLDAGLFPSRERFNLLCAALGQFLTVVRRHWH